MRYRKLNLLLALVISPFSLVTDCAAQATDPKFV